MFSRTLSVCAFAALVLSLAVPVSAAEERVNARLVADVEAVQPGQPFHLGVAFELGEDWHVYWHNPGEAGLATEVQFEAPEGFAVGDLRWPRPIEFKSPGDIVSYGYEKQVLLAAEVRPPGDLPEGKNVEFTAEVSWLACDENVCVPGDARVSLALPVRSGAGSANRDLFEEWREESPPQAPPFTLKNTAGQSVSLSDYAGTVTVLEWFNPDCPFIKRHHARRSTMTDLWRKYRDQGVRWLAVSSTHYMDAETVRQWKQKWDVPYPVLMDRDGTVGRRYEAKTTPHMYVIDERGAVVYDGAIDSDPRGNAEDPTNYVDGALQDVLAGRPVREPRTRPYGCSVKYAPKTAYSFEAADIDGNPVDLSQYRGKVGLIVNTASRCGFTPQYDGLEALYEKYRDRGLVVLGFPSDSFNQEPEDNAGIKRFCRTRFGIKFPMFAKIAVKGLDRHPLYTYLTDHPRGGRVTWNFNKFLVGPDGALIARFDSRVEPQSNTLIAAVEKALRG